jgi:L-2-hydroxycarboxylate dehydrogenase (NAD+)
MVLLSADAERRLIADVLRAHGASQAEAGIVAEDVVEADLRGHDSHGLARFGTQVSLIRRGRVQPGTQPRIERESPAALAIDCAGAIGPAAMVHGIDEGIERAQTQGSCAVSLRNHGYIAYLGWYVERGLDHDCLCLLVSKGGESVHPYGGVQPLLGTNPIAAAIPTAGEPVLIDMSTSTTSMGRILAAARAAASIPEDWAVDAQGVPTTDPAAARQGALSPLGGAKGYALGLLVEFLAAILPSGDYSAGHGLWSAFALVLHIPSFTEATDFRQRASAYVKRLKSSPRAPGVTEILLPGERAYRLRRKRLASGIPHSDEVWQATARLCEETGLDATAYL